MSSSSLEVTRQSTTFREAPHPFNKSNTDVILRSSDNVEFRVHKIILMEASPFFADMFRLPQTKLDEAALPVVEMPEDSHTIELLLRICYPVVNNFPRELKTVRAVLAAAMKYDVEVAAEYLKRVLLGFIKEKPLQIFAIACILDLEDEACTAANKMAQDANIHSYISELEEVTAGAYYRLLKCHPKDSTEPIPFSGLYPLSPTPICITPAYESLSLISQIDRHPEDATVNTIRHNAQHPFDGPNADAVLISSDNVYFHVSKYVLSLVSPVFKTMFTSGPSGLPKVHPELDMTLPHFSVSQKSHILDTFLRFCYPVEKPVLDRPGDLIALIIIIKYYEATPVIQHLDSLIASSSDALALDVCLLASEYGWQDAGKTTAMLTLRRPIKNVYSPVMEYVSAGTYHRLLEYHRFCEEAVISMSVSVSQWLPARMGGCLCGYNTVPCWLRGEPILIKPQGYFNQRPGETTDLRDVVTQELFDLAHSSQVPPGYCRTLGSVLAASRNVLAKLNEVICEVEFRFRPEGHRTYFGGILGSR